MGIKRESALREIKSPCYGTLPFLNSIRQALSPLVVGLSLLASSVTNPISADQNASELPGLFSELKSATSAEGAARVEAEIWLLWLEIDDQKSSALLDQIVHAMETRNLDEALIASDELIAHNPDFAEGWNKRATIHYLMGRYESSVNDIRQTLLREPRHFGAISGLGLIFLRKGDLPSALEAFERVLEISPQSINAQRSAESVKGQIGEEI